MAPRLAWQIIDGEAVVIDLAKGRQIGLNATGSLVWSLLDDERRGDDRRRGRAAGSRSAWTAARQDVHEFLDRHARPGAPGRSGMSAAPAEAWLRLKRRAVQLAQPLTAYLELTYRCNWRCVFCYNPRHGDLQPL